MNNESITPEVSKRICNHMNKEHKDSIISYANNYAGIEKPLEAEMLDITREALYLKVDGQNVEIIFDHILKDSKDAHQTLVDMLKKNKL